MAVVRRANALTVAMRILQEKRVSLIAKLAAYCTRRVIELGLVAKTYSHGLHLGSNLAESRKTVGKLKTMLLKYILKNVPYVAFSMLEYIQVKDQTQLVVNLSPSEQYPGIPEGLNWEASGYSNPPPDHQVFGSTSAQMMLKSLLPETRWIRRYTGYLNYLFRKYNVPLRAIDGSTFSFDRAVYQSIRNLDSSAERATKKIPFTLIIKITFEFCKWSPGNSILTRYRRVQEEGHSLESDPIFRRNDSWENYSIIGLDYDALPEAYRYSPEKLFLHMDKGVQMLTTLTRKVKYGSSAFSFRGSE